MHGTFIKHEGVLKNLSNSHNDYYDKIIINNVHVRLVLNMFVICIIITHIKVYV